MDLSKVCKDIRTLKVQGAANVARYALMGYALTAARSKAKTKQQFFSELNQAKKKLFATRPTEPAMRNYINFVTRIVENEGLTDVKRLKLLTQQFSKKLIAERKKEKEKLYSYGANEIKSGSIVFTHCHSSSVMGVLKEARKKRKFQVYNTETRPLFQGRKTAKELAKVKIPVTHFVDSAARVAIKKSDIMLIGADSITPTRVFNKIGSEMFAEIAQKYGVPVYVCSSAWKFNPLTTKGFGEKIEERNPNEIWKFPPKGVKIKNYAFEKVHIDLIEGFISELGVLNSSMFFQEIKLKHPWMFQ
ncbi:MAG: hypothetical protein ABIF40_03895 [archaeon]